MGKKERPKPSKERVEKKLALRPKGIKVEIRSCDELKAVIGVRIRAQVKDPRLARELEAALADLRLYGTGGGEEGVLV
jgi:hypothetical protein